MKTRLHCLFILMLSANVMFAQYKYEREFRIKKSQMPEVAIQLFENTVVQPKRLKFYKETDSTKNSYEAKFKKDRLWYSMEFDADGTLEDIEITIEPIDIPSDALANIKAYFEKTFKKHRIKKIQQQHLASKEEALEKTLRNAFQNLLIPSLNYEIIVSGKIEKDYLEYEVLFDADGTFINRRKRLPPNYDHVLY